MSSKTNLQNSYYDIIKRIDSLSSMIPPNDILVILNIEGTLISSNDRIINFHSDSELEKIYNQITEKLTLEQIDILNTLKYQSSTCKLSDSAFPNFIKSLSKKHVNVIGLATSVLKANVSTSVSIEKSYTDKLKEFEIDFSNNKIILTEPPLPTFENGILFTNGEKKNAVSTALSEFLNYLKTPPKGIIFIDNNKEHISKIEKVVKSFKENIFFESYSLTAANLQAPVSNISKDDFITFWQNLSKKSIHYSLPSYVVIKDPSSTNNEILRKVAKPITFPLSQEDKNDINTLLAKYDNEENCAGLAAPQIGIAKQIIIFEVKNDSSLKKWRPDLNQTMPKTIWLNPIYKPIGNDFHEDYEGCFSVFDLAAPIKRFKNISYRAYDESGQIIEGVATGFLARVIQHEIDHLNGKLFIDYAEKNSIFSIVEYRKRRMEAMQLKNDNNK